MSTNTAAKLVDKLPKLTRITPVLNHLHWLPVRYRIKFKILLMAFKAINGMPPDYICRLINPKPLTNYALRSNRKFLLKVTNGRCWPHLEREHLLPLFPISGTIYRVRLVALFLYLVLNILLRLTTFLNGLLVCNLISLQSYFYRYFYYILIFLCLMHFTFVKRIWSSLWNVSYINFD